MGARSAQKRAIAIPEILEAILLRIPSRDLLVSVQLVSKSWHTAVTSSPVIQQLLFFEQCPDHSRNHEFSHLLNAAFPPFFNHNSDEDGETKWAQESLSGIDWNSSPAKIDAYSRQEASWRRMLAVQPPITRVDIIKSCSSMTGISKIKGNLSLPEGLRMGTLYDLVEAEAHTGPAFESTDFDVKWHLSASRDAPCHPSSTGLSIGAKNEDASVTVVFIRSESCVDVQRRDCVPPDLSKFESEKERREAILKAFMSNARPHLVSKARAPIEIVWGEEKSIRRWR